MAGIEFNEKQMALFTYKALIKRVEELVEICVEENVITLDTHPREALKILIDTIVDDLLETYENKIKPDKAMEAELLNKMADMFGKLKL